MIYNNINMYNSDKKLFERKTVVVEDGLFKRISNEAYAEGTDCSDKYMIPGFINTHTHLAMSLLRNYADDLNLQDWLNNEIWPIEDVMTDEDMYWGSLLAMAEMVAGGTTCFNDMYTAEHLNIKAANNIGMRGIVAQGLTNFNDSIFYVQKTKTLKLLKEEKPNTIKVGIAPHAIYTLNSDGYIWAKELSREHGLIFHTHLSETIMENNDCLKKYGKTPTKYLYDLGVLDKDTVLAHCVHLTDEDFEIIARSGASISLNISSNLKLGSGIPDVKKMLDHGINVCVGTDGASSNNHLSIIREMHILSKVVKGYNQDPCLVSAGEVINMATRNGAKALNLTKLGEIKENYTADYAIFTLDGIHNCPINNPVSAIVYSSMDSDIVEVGVDGKVIYSNGNFKGIDISEVKNQCTNIIKSLRSKL